MLHLKCFFFLQGSFRCGPCNKGFIGNQTMGCHNTPGMCMDGTVCHDNAECVRHHGHNSFSCRVRNANGKIHWFFSSAPAALCADGERAFAFTPTNSLGLLFLIKFIPLGVAFFAKRQTENWIFIQRYHIWYRDVWASLLHNICVCEIYTNANLSR